MNGCQIFGIGVTQKTWVTSYYKWILSDKKCEICSTYLNGGHLDGAYVYIINKLKEKDLLVNNYKLKCCSCKLIKDTVGGNIHKNCGGLLKPHILNHPPQEIEKAFQIICSRCNLQIGIINKVNTKEEFLLIEEVELADYE